MIEEFSRTEKVIGADAVTNLNNAKVAVFGVGGVGGHAAEALVRAGIGRIDLIDFDTVSVSNINRQIVALHSTVGKKKVDVLKARFLDINNSLCINTYDIFYNEETDHLINLVDYDYIIDAIDSVSAKVHLIKSAYEQNVKIISSMGTGNKLDATSFKVTDIFKTSVCPLAKIMRYELKKIGVKRLKCVYSEELPTIKATPPGSMPYVPAVAGLILAGEVIKDIIKK